MLERVRRHPFPVEARFDVSLVQTLSLRPAGFPAFLGQDFFLNQA